MALATKYRAGEDTSGLVHHSDRGVQAVFNWSIRFTTSLTGKYT